MGCPKQPDDYSLVIQNAKIIAITTGEIAKGDIYIQHGRIVEISIPPKNSNKYSATQTIDAKGAYALPGFWDNHVHFRGGDSLIADNKNLLKLFIANGITTVRDAGGDLTPAVMQWKQSIEEGELLGPTIFTSGPKIDGPNATWAGSLAVQNNTDIKNALDSLAIIPVDFVKLYDSSISATAYLQTIAQAEQRHWVTSGHMPFTVALDDAIDAGLDGVEHLYYILKGCSYREAEITKKLQVGQMGFWEALPALQESYDPNVAAKTFEKMKANNVYSIPTLHIGKMLSYLDEVDHSNDTYLKYMGPNIIKTYDGRINRVKNATPEALQNRKDLDQFFGKLAKSLSDAGVPMLAGSDSGAFNSYTYPGISLHKELETMVAVGIQPLKALQYSAYGGAKFLRKDKDYGELSTGKIADIVLIGGNPLMDITQTQNIQFVVKGDRFLTKKDLHKLLASAMHTK
ncbi:Amidohydrolase [Croceitalea dokdonensis DOKDO 023]|uniref:Amidohydrolase n=1 Tax=Croceitalea dokdonensis DOKDO 023 TaxID=1300341 RepID=A0A0P7AMK7_9FLAO|nr:amidohydrolase family protein [Croceitalea dokdonensis]KPM33139.1 Amidohydrolase [Croceitalea dokdonensis DOKDO 023]